MLWLPFPPDASPLNELCWLLSCLFSAGFIQIVQTATGPQVVATPATQQQLSTTTTPTTVTGEAWQPLHKDFMSS